MTNPSDSSSTPVNVLFHRDYRQFQGGHLKMWDYFQHVEGIPGYRAQIYFSPETVWDETNPWLARRPQALPRWEPETADVLFVGGMDWLRLPEAWRRNSPRPVINLIQHVRHADPNHPLFQFLDHRAVRIAASAEVGEALAASGRVNGPIITIPYGLDLPVLSEVPERDIELLIVGIKAPARAEALGQKCREITERVRVISRPVPRPEFLDAMARSRVTLFLPDVTEGFYLPAMEGMILGTLVVCPDCVGNRAFCRAGETCLMPDFSDESLIATVRQALSLPSAEREQMLRVAAARAEENSIQRERERFTDVIKGISNLYSGLLD
ncbi:MAG: glycosyltransferase [Chthoniobacteraceae bacterium]